MTAKPTATWGGILEHAPTAACPSAVPMQDCAHCCLYMGSSPLLLAPIPVERRMWSVLWHAARLVSPSRHHAMGRSSWKKERWGKVTCEAKAHGLIPGSPTSSARAVKTGTAVQPPIHLSGGLLSSDGRNPKAHSVPVSATPASASAHTCLLHPPQGAKGSPAQKTKSLISPVSLASTPRFPLIDSNSSVIAEKSVWDYDEGSKVHDLSGELLWKGQGYLVEIRAKLSIDWQLKIKCDSPLNCSNT